MRKLFLAVLALGISTVQAGTETWQVDLGDENTWSRLTFAGTLLAATENGLSHFDSESGDLLWKRDDLNKLAQFNVSDIVGTPFLIISERVGNIPPKSRLQVLNLSTGETLWDTGKFAGSGLGAYAAPDQNLLVYVADFAAVATVGIRHSTSSKSAIALWSVPNITCCPTTCAPRAPTGRSNLHLPA